MRRQERPAASRVMLTSGSVGDEARALIDLLKDSTDILVLVGRDEGFYPLLVLRAFLDRDEVAIRVVDDRLLGNALGRRQACL